MSIPLLELGLSREYIGPQPEKLTLIVLLVQHEQLLFFYSHRLFSVGGAWLLHSQNVGQNSSESAVEILFGLLL